MKTLFDIDGPVMAFVTKLATSVYLNILWAVCCLPIFTAGASTTALFYVSLKVIKDEESHLTKAFFHSFKENFRQSTIIWLILLGVGVILGVDGYLFYHMRFANALWTLGTAVFIVALAAYGIILMYIFPLLARFDNTVKAMFKNALMIGMRFLLCTALMALIYFMMALVVIRFFTPAIIFGEGLCALLCSYLLSNILQLCEKPEEAETETVPEPAQEASEALERKWSVKDVHGTAKLGYIWAYYKLPIVIGCILLYIAGYMLYGRFTHKDTVLYAALVNVSAGDAFAEELSTDFLDRLGGDSRKEKVELYGGLYLTEDEADENYGYVYASNVKITASIAGGLLDVALMDQEAFDLFSQKGYLCNMEQFLMQEAPDLYQKIKPCLVSNRVVLEDNLIDTALDSSVDYTAVTEEYPMAVDVSQSSLVERNGFDGALYLGIISNTSRRECAVDFVRYLME